MNHEEVSREEVIQEEGGRGGEEDAIMLAQLLCARLCHELVGPVGAVASGEELLSDFGAEPDAAVMQLIGNSARTAAARLRLYRAAYGSVGATGPGGPSLGEAAELTAALADGKRIALAWSLTEAARDTRPGRGAIRALLNVAILGAEALPRGGTLRVEAAMRGPELTATVMAEAADAAFNPALRAAIDAAGVAALTPRTVQGYFARQCVNQGGGALAIEDTPAGIRLTMRAPGAP